MMFMSTRELINRELDVLPESLQQEVFHFVCFLKTRIEADEFDGAAASASVLHREWDTPEEDEAWKSL